MKRTLRNLSKGIERKVDGLKKSLKRGTETTKSVIGFLLITNALSLATVAMQKNISNYSNEQSAFLNSLSAVPIMYDIGFGVGHNIFYNDANFIKTAEQLIGSKNLFPREYISEINHRLNKFIR